MMENGNIINYKNWDLNHYKEEYKEGIGFREDMIKIAESNADRLNSLYKDAILWITFKTLSEHVTLEIEKDYKYAMQGAFGHLKTVENLGKSTKLWVGDKYVELINNSQSGAHVAELMLNYFYQAHICRCQEVIDLILSQKDPGPFFHNHNLATHYTYSHFYLEKSLFKMDKESIQEQIKKIEKKAARGYKNSEEWGGWFKEAFLPLNKLRLVFHTEGEDAFNEQLQITLDKNRAYYDSKENNRFRDSDNWLPWEIISYACRAYDKGWKIKVKDSRLPMFLVEGKCKIESLAP